MSSPPSSPTSPPRTISDVITTYSSNEETASKLPSSPATPPRTMSASITTSSSNKETASKLPSSPATPPRTMLASITTSSSNEETASKLSSSPVTPPRTTSDTVTTSTSNRITEKHRLRALRRETLNTVVPKVEVRRAIKLYDLESHTEQSEEVMDEVEQILMMKGIQWPTPDYRRIMISTKMRVALRAVLTSYGYKTFMYYGENKKARLQIEPKPGREPPPLPEWLQIPYLVPMKGSSNKIIYDSSCANRTTRSGDGLYDRDKRPVGTLGVVMSSPQPGKADAYVALTAGHVIPNGDDYLLVKNRQLDSYTSLKVVPNFRRFNDRPLYRQNETRSFLDDVGILLVGNDDVKYFSRRIANINVHYFAQGELAP